MEYRLRQLPDLLRVPVGRHRLRAGFVTGLYPLLARLAGLYRRWWIPHVRVIAIVGSYGKSTTTRAVAAVLGFPVPEQHYNASSSLALRLLRVKRSDATLVVEVSVSRLGQGEFLARMFRPETTVVTCIGSEHNTSFGTLETTRREKGAMVAALPATGLAILNGDDPNVIAMAKVTSARTVTYGFGEGNDFRARDASLEWPRGYRFRLECAAGGREVTTRFLGRHQIYSALAALAVGALDGRDLDETIAAIEALPPTHRRLEPIELANGAYLLRDEVKSSLETIHAALDLLAELPVNRRVVILGKVSEPPGSQGPIYREIGARLAEMNCLAVFVGRHEGRMYRSGARAAGMPEGSMHIAAGLEEAVNWANARLRPGDVVLVKGRDSQRFERASLALTGRNVACRVAECSIGVDSCDRCPMLERGWEGYPDLA